MNNKSWVKNWNDGTKTEKFETCKLTRFASTFSLFITWVKEMNNKGITDSQEAKLVTDVFVLSSKANYLMAGQGKESERAKQWSFVFVIGVLLLFVCFNNGIKLWIWLHYYQSQNLWDTVLLQLISEIAMKCDINLIFV